jgi:hypothetical protein
MGADYISFALQVGGSVDIGLSRHFALRVFQADWLRAQFPNADTNVQNNFRVAELSSGFHKAGNHFDSLLGTSRN